MKDKLKPCPFCGNEKAYANDMNHTETGRAVAGWVICLNCGLHMEKSTKEEAIKAWNTRVKLSVKKIKDMIYQWYWNRDGYPNKLTCSNPDSFMEIAKAIAEGDTYK